jgi:hypothetical protein
VAICRGAWTQGQTLDHRLRSADVAGDYERGTTDSDVFETTDLSADDKQRLRVLAGTGTALHLRRNLYLDIVANGVPFLLKRFAPKDQGDIDAMIERDLVPHEQLVERFRSALDMYLGDAREVELPKYIANLHRVERDMLLVPETEIELPSWI